MADCSALAISKYNVSISREKISWSEIIPNIIRSFFYIWERDWQNNYVRIFEKDSNLCVRSYQFGIYYLSARAKKKIIEEDLENLSIEEFEEKYEIINKPIKEPELKFEELN